MHKTAPNAGFSLVELSIVLVILGLLVGGVLGGRSLIRSAELRAVINEYQSFQTAVNTFRGRFNAYPGDFAQATQFWGTASNCSNWIGPVSTDGSTCNGNGDGKLIGNGGASDTTYEMLWFWQHLSNAGLVAGNFNGSITASGFTPDESMPVSKFNSAGWLGSYMTCEAGTACFLASSANYLGLIRFPDLSDPDPDMNIISPEDAWNIDAKLDDGKPATGIMVTPAGSGTGSSPDCTITSGGGITNRTHLDAQYNFSNTNAVCWLVFRNT